MLSISSRGRSRLSQLYESALVSVSQSSLHNHNHNHMRHAILTPFSTESTPSTVSNHSNDQTHGFNINTYTKPPTAVVMLNMGGPSTLDEVQPFLTRLFSDGEIIRLGKLQPWLGPYIAKKRTPRIRKQYESIGGSPIRKWTEIQGQNMIKLLDELSPESAPHKAYIAFRYAPPLTEDTLKQMEKDGVQRAIAFSQYPQFSCTTTGSSLNHLWREILRLQKPSSSTEALQLSMKWSVIDRWPLHRYFVEAVIERIEAGLLNFPQEARSRVIILFSAHSLPMLVVNRGDPYSSEVSATVHAVVAGLRRRNHSNPHMLAWQSQVGYLPWLGPNTGEALKGLGNQGHQHVLVVPIAFTSDHVETLFEIDKEYAEVAHKHGISHFVRSESLNDSALLAKAQASIVAEHIRVQIPVTPEYALNCSGCTNDICRTILNSQYPYTKWRDLKSSN